MTEKWIQPQLKNTGHRSVNPMIKVNRKAQTQVQYTLTLVTEPGSSVSIYPSDNADPDQVLISPSEVIFTPLDWQEPKTVTVTAIDGITLGTDPPYTFISHAVVSGDSNYSDICCIDNTTVMILENECGAWGYSPADIDQDCQVSLADFAILASEWLKCSEPYAAGCITY